MRLGGETIEPDVHVLSFVSTAIGRAVSEDEAVSALEQVADRLGVKAWLLDWSIWEYQSGAAAAIGGDGGRTAAG